MSNNPVELIRRKRDGETLSAEEISWFVQGYTRNEIADYQMAAMLMAICWRGMGASETVALTHAMLQSGTELRVRDTLTPVADKHSTGGVGDKVTLAVAPLVAACGLPMAKMSGRGLGHTGGTIDKLESLSGFRTTLSSAEFLNILKRHGLALAAQSSDLAPADGKMYALRDVTATVESLPLIAASIMSKKLAIGPSVLLLDVKVGSGAFMKTETDARRLAEIMTQIGEAAGVRTIALLTAMDQPLGRAIGNALELAEAIATLRGEGPEDITTICLHETALLLAMSGIVASEDDGRALAERALQSGAGLDKLQEVVAAQGGNPVQIADTSLLPQAPHREILVAPQSGYIKGIDAERLGLASVTLGAGRTRKGEEIDHTVGLILFAKIGDYLAAGEPLLEIHARNSQEARAIQESALGAYTWSDQALSSPPLLLGSVSSNEQ